MENKLTKSRLSNFFAYEWIAIIVTIIVTIFCFEMIYPAVSQGLTVGQEFKYYYDSTISAAADGSLKNLFAEKNTFSYDVLKVSSESIVEENNVLSLRLSVQSGDIFITDTKVRTSGSDNYTRINSLIDAYETYSFDALLEDAKAYVAPFIIGYDAVDFYNPTLNEAEIEKNFNKRMSGDNRFRFSESARKEGVKKEIERIKTLCTEIADFEKALLHDELFYSYRRYEQALAVSTEGTKEYTDNEQKYNAESVKRYALKVDALSGVGKNNPSQYFTMYNQETATNVVIAVFNFKTAQPDLQYETISFINAIVRDCSNILD